jgi:hypothetical protein
MLRLCGRCVLGNTYWSLVTGICICPLLYFSVFFFCGATAHHGPRPPHCWSVEVTYRLGRSSLDEGSASRRDRYLTTHNTHRRQTSMPLVRFEPASPPNVRLQTARPQGSASASYTVIYLFSWACEFELDYHLGTAVGEMYHDTAPSYV